jgi:HEAT repeat protein
LLAEKQNVPQPKVLLQVITHGIVNAIASSTRGVMMDSVVISALLELLIGERLAAVEASKKLIQANDSEALDFVCRIAEEPRYPSWSRTMGIYALGMSGYVAAVQVLAFLIENPKENLRVRCHAAEAVGNIGDPCVIPLLQAVLRGDHPPSLKKWSLYALSQIRGAEASEVLQSFKESNLSSGLRKEVRVALQSQKQWH